MRLEDLRSDWEKFKMVNAMESADKGQILQIIENDDNLTKYSFHRTVINVMMFVLFVICFKGG